MIRFRSKRTRVRGADGILLGFVNLPAAKHLTRVFEVFARGPKELGRTAGDVLLVHGVHSPWLAFGAFASHRLAIPCVVVMTDPPNVAHEFDTSLTRILKRLDQRVARALLSRLDGVVALTRPLAEDFAPGLPYMVMEGIAPGVSEKSRVPHSKSGAPVVLYAGGLSEEYGDSLLLDAHALILSALGCRSPVVGRSSHPCLHALRENLTWSTWEWWMLEPSRNTMLQRMFS